MNAMPNRRRFIRIAAAATLAQLARPAAGSRGEEHFVTWRGLTMGTLTHSEVRDTDDGRTGRILAAAAQEIARLEKLFTLYQADSALVSLNRHGLLADPPFDLVRLLAEACEFSQLTGG